MNAIAHDKTPYTQLVEERNALARALWAVRVLWRATAKGHHISQPYPKSDVWTMLDTKNSGYHERDTMHVGATPEACVIAAAEALVAEDPSLDV